MVIKRDCSQNGIEKARSKPSPKDYAHRDSKASKIIASETATEIPLQDCNLSICTTT